MTLLASYIFTYENIGGEEMKAFFLFLVFLGVVFLSSYSVAGGINCITQQLQCGAGCNGNPNCIMRCNKTAKRCIGDDFQGNDYFNFSPSVKEHLVIDSGASSGSATQCVSFDRNAYSAVGHHLINSCSSKIYVSWKDEGGCSRICGTTVGGGARKTVTRVEGNVRWAACFSPQYPVQWRGGSSFRCSR